MLRPLPLSTHTANSTISNAVIISAMMSTNTWGYMEPLSVPAGGLKRKFVPCQHGSQRTSASQSRTGRNAHMRSPSMLRWYPNQSAVADQRTIRSRFQRLPLWKFRNSSNKFARPMEGGFFIILSTPAKMYRVASLYLW